MCPFMASNCSSMCYQRFTNSFLISAASLGTFFLSNFFYFFFHKELFRLQVTLEFQGVELDTCFPWNSMSLCCRKFPPHSAPRKRIDRFILNDRFAFRRCVPRSWLAMTTVRTTHVNKVIGRDSILGVHPLPLLQGYTTKPLFHVP